MKYWGNFIKNSTSLCYCCLCSRKVYDDQKLVLRKV